VRYPKSYIYAIESASALGEVNPCCAETFSGAGKAKVKIPQPTALVALEHNGQLLTTTVDDLEGDPRSDRFWYVTLAAPTDVVFQESDRYFWITSYGRIPAHVRALVPGVVAKVVLLAIADKKN
jgi:hypothetical protein